MAKLVERAESLALSGDWGLEAGKINAAILKLDRGNIPAHTRLARWCLEQRRFEDAEGLYRRVLQLDPGNRIAQNHLADVNRRKRYRRTLEGLTTFEQAFRRGVEERHKGHGELAIAILEHAETMMRSDAARIALAGAYRDMGQGTRAEIIYRSILSRYEHHAAQVGLAAVLRDRGQLAEAESLCRAVLKRYPRDEHAQRTFEAIVADRTQPWRREAQYD